MKTSLLVCFAALFLLTTGCHVIPIEIYVSEDVDSCHVLGVVDAVTFYEQTFDQQIYNIRIMPSDDEVFEGRFAHRNSITVRQVKDLKLEGVDATATHRWLAGRSIIGRIEIWDAIPCQEPEAEAHLLGHEMLHIFGFEDEYGDEWKQHLIYGRGDANGWELNDKQRNRIKKIIRR